MKTYKAKSYQSINDRILWGVVEPDGVFWAIEPEWSEKRAQAIAKALNDNPDVEPYDLDIREVGNDK